MDFETALQVFSYRNFDALAAMPDAELLRYVIDLLAASESSTEPVDHDKLLSTGITIARTKKPDVAAAVTGWLQSRQSVRRIDAACALLSGLWHPQFFEGQIQPANLRALLDNWRLATGDDDAAASFVFALYQASRNELTAEARGVLKELVGAIQQHPPSIQCESLIRDQLVEIESSISR